MAKLFSARSGIYEFPLSLMDRWAEPPEPPHGPEAVILAVIGMSLRQVILAVIVGVLLAAVLLWLAPELVR